MLAWQVWVVVAVALMTLEVLTPGFVIACFGIGGLFGMLAALTDFGIVGQGSSFVVGTLVAFIGIRPFVLKFLYRSSDHIPTNVDALAGRTGLVIQAIRRANPGRVKVGGEDWMAVTQDDLEIERGVKVEIIRVEGAKVLVSPLTLQKEEK